MSIAKVVETLAEGPTIEKAVENAVAETSRSIRNIQSVYVKDIQAPIENGRVGDYRVNCKVTFLVENGAEA